jgi:CheY-like chemotaxis protein
MSLILLAEDNTMVAMVMKLDLEEGGHTVLGPFDRVADALVAATAEVDLALLDIDLAGGDRGTDLAKALTEKFGTRCLFVTGQNTEAEDYAPYAVGVLSKPFSSKPFIDAVNAALGGAEQVEGKGGQIRWF